jgi:hypothetical protein
MNETNIMQELNIVLACLEQSENTFLLNKVKKVMEDLEFYFGSSEAYHQEIRGIINDSQS